MANDTNEAGTRILDVGCGDAKVRGAVGIDCAPLPGVDVVHDLTKFPWPFPDETFDKVYMLNIIEHLPDTISIMEEVHRLVKKGGTVHIEVVYWNHMHSISDPQHVRFFNEITWEFFTGKRKGYYTKAQFHLESFDYIYDANARRLFRFERLMDVLSHYLCNIKQGMKVVLKK
jgi:ubiquinone/menaquinone biosynthesis C-methylase UbiE